MIKQDFLINQIRGTIKQLLKMYFHIDLKTSSNDFLDTKEEKEIYKKLLERIDRGEIDEAENELYELEDTKKVSVLKIALLFYNYLNEMNEYFLFQNNFSREEIDMGLRDMISRYGLEDFLRFI